MSKVETSIPKTSIKLRKMVEDIIALLSNMGAINESGAISVELLLNSNQLKHIDVKEELKKLEVGGYIVRLGDRICLTQTGLVRALSGLS